MRDIFTQINRLRARYIEARGLRPMFVVMDAKSFLECVSQSYFQDGFPSGIYSGLVDSQKIMGLGSERVTVCGLNVVVIPTDGMPMLLVTGWPTAEAIELVRLEQNIPRAESSDDLVKDG